MRATILLRRALLAAFAALAVVGCRLDTPQPSTQTTSPQLKANPRWAINGVPSDFITGGGWFSVQYPQLNSQIGNKATFGWHGGVKNGEWWGEGEFHDHGTGLDVHSTQVTGYARAGTDSSESPDNHPAGTRVIGGWAETNLFGTVRYVVQMTDSPDGKESDQFHIALVDPASGNFVYGASGSLGNPTPGDGDIELHRGNNSNVPPSTPPDIPPDPF